MEKPIFGLDLGLKSLISRVFHVIQGRNFSPITSVASQLQSANDFLAELQQKAQTTQRGYAGNIKIFFEYFLQRKPTPRDIEEFWALDDQTANGLILKFKKHLVAEGRKAATINRYLAAIKYLIKVGRNLKRCQYHFDSDRTSVNRKVFKNPINCN
ncbi:hypothetical protein F7734_12870 [Scytonema sp. UIC 10036]|uniref:site-specific integrase n=1 Tax=Scytonema sp. UIC 10036 TaxID=2304196 RepID=UPI0012DA0A13|nr:site-specific integrase [Scytonema sp. UIC 10036]MUG93274.1 hypothetical protein [Scytonema sp. UIC 10036]